jgi:hypothetical protein
VSNEIHPLITLAELCASRSWSQLKLAA